MLASPNSSSSLSSERFITWHAPCIGPENSCYSKIRWFKEVFSLWYRNAKPSNILWVFLVAEAEIQLKPWGILISWKTSSSISMSPFHQKEVFFSLQTNVFLHWKCLKMWCRNLLMKCIYLRCNLFLLQHHFPARFLFPCFHRGLFIFGVRDDAQWQKGCDAVAAQFVVG